MLGDDERRVGGTQRRGVFVGVCVGRVEEDDVGLNSFECLRGFATENDGAVVRFQRGDVAPDYFDGHWRFFDEGGAAGTSRNCFETDGAAAGVGVDEVGVFDFWLQDAEEGFAEAIWRGADVHAGDGFDTAAAEFSGNYAHGVPRRKSEVSVGEGALR